MADCGTIKRLKDGGVIDGVSSMREQFERKASEKPGTKSVRGPPLPREQQTTQRKGSKVGINKKLWETTEETKGITDDVKVNNVKGFRDTTIEPKEKGDGQIDTGKSPRKTWGYMEGKGHGGMIDTAKETKGKGYDAKLNLRKSLRDTGKEPKMKVGDDKQVDIGQSQRETTETSKGKVDNDQVAIVKGLRDTTNGNNGGEGIGDMIDTGRETAKERFREQLSLPEETPNEEDDYTDVWYPKEVQYGSNSEQVDQEKLLAGEDGARDRQDDDDDDDDGKYKERHVELSAGEEVLRSLNSDTERQRVDLRRIDSADGRRKGCHHDTTLDQEAMAHTQSTPNMLHKDPYSISKTNSKHTVYGRCSNKAEVDTNMVKNYENSYIATIVPDYITVSRDSDEKSTKAKSGIIQKEHETENKRPSTSSRNHNDKNSDTQTAKVKEDFLRPNPVRRSERPTTSFYTQLSIEMDAMVSRDESSFENVSIKCRPKVVADLYSALCTGEWLNAKEEMENEKTLDEDVQLKFLCSVLEISLNTAKNMKASLDEKLQNILMPVLSQPFHALSDQDTTGPKHKRPTDRLPDQLLTPIGDYLRAHVKEVDTSPLKQTVTSELKDHLRMSPLQHSDILSEGQNGMQEYIKACSDLAWMMVIQRPHMTFQMEKLGSSFREYTQEASWGSADPANPTSRVDFYVYPAMYHAEQLMAKGKVKLVEVKLRSKPGK